MCDSTSLCASYYIGQDLDKNSQTDILYLDFAKAFHSVDHLWAIILEKLRGYGVTGSVLCWLADYLSGGTRRVVVDGVALTWSAVASRSAARKHLSTLGCDINDLPDFVKNGTETALYADDTKLHKSITSTHD